MRRFVLSTSLWIGLGGCLHIPPPPHPAELPAAAPVSADTAGAANWPSAEWWKQYRDPDLDRLVDLALAASPTLASAHARLDTARESVRLAGAATGAHVEATGDASRQRLSDNGLFPPNLLGFHWYDQFDLGLQASYTFDWWGKQRDAVESAIDEARASQADRTAATLVLASSVTDAYFAWQADQARLVLTREREATVLREAGITRARIQAGLDSAEEQQRADAAVAAVREQLAALEGAARLQQVALAALVDRSVAALPALSPKPLPAVTQGLPDDVTLDLMARRADLTASRWRVEVAERNRAAARAEFFPDVSINALVGLQSRDLVKLLRYDSRVPEAAAAIHLPLFDAGRLEARYGAAGAALDAAVAGYTATLLDAARDVATQAATREQIGAQRAERQRELEAAQRLGAAAAARVRQGVADPRVELTAEENLMEQRDALLQLDAAAVAADIGLKRALGGGYERDGTRDGPRP